MLRIEDTDLQRSEKAFEDQLMEDMRWLGMNWDEGVGVGGTFGPYRQTDRFDIYSRHATRLLEEGHAYYCFCSQEELEAERQRQLAEKRMPKYSGKCRSMDPQIARRRRDAGEPATVRLRVREGEVGFDDLVFGPLRVQTDTIGDPILLRSDGSPNYNFSCVVDDLLMHISHVIRGEGHLSNTHRQVLIYEALGAAPPAFAHLSTILGKDGEKLSKRHGATSVLEFRKMGYLPEAMVNYLSLLGWAPPGEGQEILSIDETIRLFSLERVNRHPAIFDPDKLDWVSRNHIKSANVDDLAGLSAPYLQQAGWIPEDLGTPVRDWLQQVVLAVRNYLDRMEQITAHSRLIFQYDPASLSAADLEELRQPESESVLGTFRELCRGRRIRNAEDYKAMVLEVRSRTGVKGRKLFHPIRLALTGTTSGLELESLIPLLEQGAELHLPRPVEGCAERMARMIDFLRS